MQFFGLALIAAVLAALLVLLVVRYGWHLRWLAGWVKGNVLLLGLVLATLIGLLAWDLQYEAVLSGAGEERRVRLTGDLWELEVEVLRWHGLASLIGLQDGYRMHRLLGRYIALEQQRDAGSALSANFNPTPAWRDLWVWVDRLESQAMVQADAFEVRFVPLVDGARFALAVGPTGLTPEPLNAQARAAMKGL